MLQQDAALGSISTVVLRGSTEGFLDDVERAVNNAINTYKALCRDSRMLAGGGAPEIELARQVGPYLITLGSAALRVYWDVHHITWKCADCIP